MSLKVPTLKLEAENGDIINYNFFIVNLSNGKDLRGGLNLVYSGKSLAELLIPYSKSDAYSYLRIVKTNHYIRLDRRTKRHNNYNDPHGDIYTVNISMCNQNKAVLYGMGSLTGRIDGNSICGYNYLIHESIAYENNLNRFINITANWAEKTSETWLTSPVFKAYYKNTFVPYSAKYMDTSQSIWSYGTEPWTMQDEEWTNKYWTAFFGDTADYFYPNYPFTPSESGGGTGDGDIESDEISTPSLPSSVALNGKMITMYNPNTDQLTDFSSFLWSDSFIDDIKQLFNNPMDCIISLKMFYNDIPTTHSGTIKLGNVSSGVECSVVGTQYVELDCGTISINEFFGSALDYNPYTTIDLYLPFCNTIPLNVDEVMGANINVTYQIDILSGACVAHVTVIKNIDGTELNSVLYSVGGNCASDIPLSHNGAIGILTALSGVLASSVIGIATGGVGSIVGGVVSSAVSVSATKQKIQKNANVSSNIGAMSIKKPYITINRPIQSIAEEYNKFVGFPLNVAKKLKDISGFVTVDSAILSFNALTEEKEMIMDLLQSGVFV